MNEQTQEQKDRMKDILAHDYIHRPENYKFNNMCSYELFMRYKKKYLSFAQMNQLENACSRATSEDVDDTEDNMKILKEWLTNFLG